MPPDLRTKGDLLAVQGRDGNSGCGSLGARCGKSGEGGGGDCDERPSRAALKGGHRRNEESRGCGGEECDQTSDKLQEWQGDASRVKDGEKLGGGGGAEPRVAERNPGLRPTVCFAHKQPR